MTRRRRWVAAPLTALAVLSGAAWIDAPAQAATIPHYVGIVISGDKTACVKWKSGITGDAVLNAVASVHYRPSDGIIDQIDGKPSPVRTDDTHYWSYWHNTGSGWKYSSVGASSYAPKAGTVEGWNYINGSSTASAPSNSGSYSALCGKLDAKKSTTSTKSHTSATKSTHRAAGPVNAHVYHPRHPAAATPTASTRSGSTAATTSATATPGTSSAAGAAADTARPPSTATTSSTTSSSSDGAGVVVMSGSPVADQHRVSAGSAWPTVLGIALCVLLGAGALAGTALRRRAARG